MGHATYYNKKKERLPSVTTILSRFKDSGGLIYWAWQQGRDGKDFRETKQEAADAGTLAHQAMEAWKKKQPYSFPDNDIGKRAQMSFSGFLEWVKQSKLVITETEMPLVSEKYQFGGTLDAIMVSDKRAIGDYKTSNGLYTDYLIQIAAYGILWEENFPNDPATGGFHLLRFDKEFGDFTHKWWGELDSARKSFILMRKLYDYDKELKKRVK